MILYKYVGFDAGIQILETNSLGFSHLEDFNDPFECTGFGFYDLDVPISVAVSAFRNRFSRKYAILSLTRTALNPLMWSHYGDSYKGIVVGIDTEKAGFDDDGKFIIPAAKGEMIYLRTKPKKIHKVGVDELMSVGDSDWLNWGKQASLLKHGLLYKMQEWAYEEEVRIVKNISKMNFSYHTGTKSEAFIDDQQWKRIQLETRPLYALALPNDAIVEVFVGKNAYLNQRRKQENNRPVVNHIVDKFEDLKRLCLERSLPLYRVDGDFEEWRLRSNVLGSR